MTKETLQTTYKKRFPGPSINKMELSPSIAARVPNSNCFKVTTLQIHQILERATDAIR